VPAAWQVEPQPLSHKATTRPLGRWPKHRV